MKIIAVVNQKGGAGKTTTAQAIADCLAHRGYKVVLLDTDKQQSSQNFKLRRDEHHPDLPQIAVYTVGSKFSSESLRAHFGSFDYIIIDGPGGRDNHIDSMTICAVCSADLVLLPLKTSTHDVDQTLLTINRIKERQQITGGSPLTRAIITAAVPAKKTYKAVLEFLDGQELVKMRNDLTNRTLHEALPAEGLSAIYSGDKRAVQEINEITDEVESYFVKTK